jgi:hypothetical protein
MERGNIFIVLIFISITLLLFVFQPESKYMDSEFKIFYVGFILVGTLFFLLMEVLEKSNSDEKEVSSLRKELEKKILKKNKKNKKNY